MMALSTLSAVGNASALTLDECRTLARENYPAIQQYDLLEQTKEYDLSNASKAWLPKISVQAGAYGFTDILDSGSRISQMGVNVKNYVVSGDITIQQTVYDGGQIVASKRIVTAKAEADARQTDVTLYNVQSRAEEMYFSILLIDEQLKQNDILQDDLKVGLKTVEEMMHGGIANQSDVDAIKVELLNATQQRDALCASRLAYLKMLSTFIAKDIDENTTFERPAMVSVNSTDATLRPEMALFSSQDNLLEAQRKKLNSALLPTISVIGMGMIHTKVSDVVNKGLLLGGVSVSWNIGALYTRKNDIQKLNILRQQNDVQRQTFLFQNRLQQEETDGSILALRKLLESDDEIVHLRENIRSKADKKVEAGTESVNDLVRDINAVSRARAQRATHEIQLLKAIYGKKTLNGE